MPRVALLVATWLAALSRAQDAGDGDASPLIAALCHTDTAVPSSYADTAYAPVITQSGPLELTVSTTLGGADAFWLHDDDGELLGFQAVNVVMARTATFSIARTAPLRVTAFAHYADGCRIAESRSFYTSDGEIDCFGDGGPMPMLHAPLVALPDAA